MYQSPMNQSNINVHTDTDDNINSNGVRSSPPPLQSITNTVNNSTTNNNIIQRPPATNKPTAITTDMVGGLFVTTKPITVHGGSADKIPVGTPGRVVWSQRQRDSVVSIFGAPYDDIECTISTDQCTFGMFDISGKLGSELQNDENPRFLLYMICH